ncbi:MAG: trehalose-6-phosphate synthase, partial [Cyclobacteriaceae bacterium]|nr:trehalose-6-phosphate synthase [Cyclobacteriaceae bacterium]
MGKTIIVSNRLPVRIEAEANGKLKYIPSEGGLATGLGSVYKGGGNIWIGWPGITIKETKKQEEVRSALKDENMWPVFLKASEIKGFYEGFCNSTLWPNFHYFTQYAIYKRSQWEEYVSVNEKFCDEVLKIAEVGDTIWVHDYQLFLLPGMIRKKMANIGIGFFLHIPFPSHEVFRLIPWRKELLDGVLGADLIGFHTYDDMRHFLSAVNRLVYLPNNYGRINKGTRVVEVDSFPMGIDYDKFSNQAADPQTINFEEQYRNSLGKQKLILSIDRLDYSKGIPERLIDFELFFNKYPEYTEKVSLILLVVPSRDKVDQYKELKEEVDLLVGRINGHFGTM